MGRINPHQDLRSDPCAIVCFGPSLNDTWEKIRDFKYIFSCSGAHPFLIERGIIPTWHVAVDPRIHQDTLMGPPHKDVDYLIASTCHPSLFDHLEGYKVTLWHVFDTAEDGFRTLPPGEWALTGGCGVGLRAMTIARFFGFQEQHIFGMDGSEGKTGKHATAHPIQAKQSFETIYNGVMYLTTPAFLEAARMTFHELNQMPDVKATFYGEGLVQAMAKNYVPEPVKEGKNSLIAFNKPELITEEYRALNIQLHKENLAYGVGGGKEAPVVLKLATQCNTKSILDYGCGKGYLAKAIPFPIWEYDPAIPGKDAAPRPADLVVCADVLEHIEPDKLIVVLDDIRRCLRQVGYFVIHTGPAQKTYADGRNTHLIQQNQAWWERMLNKFFEVGKIITVGQELHIVVGPRAKKGPVPPGAVGA
ncbi:MAG: 6-hydroxymethylpterin diphosphokinase MptE-like protein [Nitrospiria bacterium]